MAQYMHGLEQVEDKDILVKEFRKGSWDDKMAATLEFVNTKLKSKGQLLEIALTMSNTDWQACIHIYYYRTVDIMQKYGKDEKTYSNHGNLLCAWKRYHSSWGNASKEAVDTIQNLCKTPGKLFGVKHACGNHAHTHGGAVIFILYWDGIKELPKYKEQEGASKGDFHETKQDYQ